MCGEPPGTVERFGVEFANMHILVINPGSSSIKFSIYFAENDEAPRAMAEGELSGIGGGEPELSFHDAAGKDLCTGEGKAASVQEGARTYALPEEVRCEGVRRYGFHGLSCESVVQEMREGGVVAERFVIAHLGSGCSVTSVKDGRSVYNTMGLTPTGGVMMGTRPGDLDPGVLLYLLRREGETVESVEAMLNREAGLKALGGVNDMRELRRRALDGNAD